MLEKGNKVNLGRRHTEEWKRRMSERMRGNKHSKGMKPNKTSFKVGHKAPETAFKKGIPQLHLMKDNPSYGAIHNWVRLWKGRPLQCEKCGKIKTTPKPIQWANIDHKYKRVLNDYIALCASCHKF